VSASASAGIAGWLMPDRSPLTSAMKTGTPMRGKRSASDLQRDGLAGAGGAGDQAVAVGQRGQQQALGVGVAGKRRMGSAMSAVLGSVEQESLRRWPPPLFEASVGRAAH